MEKYLIDRREYAMDRADKALEAAWPDRKSARYVQEMQWAAQEIEKVACEMQKHNIDFIEQSRTYSYLGSIYSDLAPALGKKNLFKAQNAYISAEKYLKGSTDEFMQAKLDFNYANTLRQIDPNNIAQLKEAKNRLLSAKAVFLQQAPQFIQQVDSALNSVNKLLKITPVLKQFKSLNTEMAKLKEVLERGGQLSDILQKTHNMLKQKNGFTNLINEIQLLTDELSSETQISEQLIDVQQKMKALKEFAIGNNIMESTESEILSLLRERLKAELNQKNVNDDRAETLRNLLEQMGDVVSIDGESLPAILEKIQKMRDSLESRFEMMHYLSHGIPRPPSGSRAAELVQLCWLIRRFLLEEINYPNKTPEESKALQDLNIRSTKLDRRIYEIGNVNERAQILEKEEFRPFALEVRNFSARKHAMLAQPIWSAKRKPIQTSSVFYIGSSSRRDLVINICRKKGLTLMPVNTGERIAEAYWQQIQQAATTIFDFSIEFGPARAEVAYALGIALTIGKPVVILTTIDKPLPFDVEIGPVILTESKNDVQKLTQAIDRSLVWVYEKTQSTDYQITLNYVLAKYKRPVSNIYLDQMLKLLEDQKKEPDSVMITRTIRQFVDLLNDGESMLIFPLWHPVYPLVGQSRLFHVMPFRPEWADEVTSVTRNICAENAIIYIRGDKVSDSDVIGSIWQEIAIATYVMVDITGFNPNVALEMGIAHTLGKPTLLVGHNNSVDKLFSMISKLRVHAYKDALELGVIVNSFINT